MNTLCARILSMPVCDEFEHGKWTVYRMDTSTWKVHETGTHPDRTGEFLDGPHDVRDWAHDHTFSGEA